MAKTSDKSKTEKLDFPIERKSYLYILIGVVILIIGFILMSGGKAANPNEFNSEIFSFRRITLAPIIVVVGFVLILWAIMRKPKS